MLWLLAYDVTDPRRLQRVHRCMVQHALPVEYSVFLFDGDAPGLQRCLQDLSTQLRPQDDMRVYPLPQRGWQGRLGKATLPLGIVWTGLPARLRADAIAAAGHEAIPSFVIA